MKRLLIASLIVICCCSGGLLADTTSEIVRTVIENQTEYFASNNIRFLDLRISPRVQFEFHSETPLEIGIIAIEDRIPEFLETMNKFTGGKALYIPCSINISATAEPDPSKKPLLSMNFCTNIIASETPQTHDSIKINTTDNLYKALVILLDNTSFTPLVARKVVLPPVPSAESPIQHESKPASTGSIKYSMNKNVWLTNLRIDSDFRVQITGYALTVNSITKLCRDLEKDEIFIEMQCPNMNSVTYEKIPVFRFDLSGRISR